MLDHSGLCVGEVPRRNYTELNTKGLMGTRDSSWDELIQLLKEYAPLEWHEMDLVKLKGSIARVGGLVQPFDWMRWREPFPQGIQLVPMDLQTVVKHVTRIVRGERFYENSLLMHVQQGGLLSLVLRGRYLTGGDPVPNVFPRERRTPKTS